MAFKSKKDDDFNEASYVKVNDRIRQFREERPEGLIRTRRHAEDGGIYFECEILRNPKDAELYATTKIPAATGHAYLADEDRADDKVEEYCETVAIGRALACLGYGVEKSIASAEEMERFEKTHGEEPEEDEEEEKPKRRRRRKAASKSKNSDDEEEEESEEKETKLRSSRKINRSSRLSKRAKKK